MIQNSSESLIILSMVVASTIITRFLPFIIFSRKKDSSYINYLSGVLPYASIGLLVVYCLKNIDVAEKPYALPEIIAVACIVALQYWKENILLSIATSTAVYMLFVQYIV